MYGPVLAFYSQSKILLTQCQHAVGVSPHQQTSLRHQLGVLQVNSTLTLSAWRGHQIPQPTRSSSTSDASHKPGLSHRLQADWLQLAGSKDPTVALISLPEQLTGHLLDHLFIIKGCTSGAARWKRCIRGRAWRCQALSQCNTFLNSPCVHPPGSFQILSFRVFMKTSLQTHD